MPQWIAFPISLTNKELQENQLSNEMEVIYVLIFTKNTKEEILNEPINY